METVVANSHEEDESTRDLIDVNADKAQTPSDVCASSSMLANNCIGNLELDIGQDSVSKESSTDEELQSDEKKVLHRMHEVVGSSQVTCKS